MRKNPRCSYDGFRRAGVSLGAFFSLMLSFPALGQNYVLYTPKVWSAQERKQFEGAKGPEKEPKRVAAPKKARPVNDQVQEKDGVLFREVTVRRGDSISSIALRLRGEGASYAGTLRFNGLRPSDLIYPGDVIRVPLNLGKKAGQSAAAQLPAKARPLVKQPPIVNQLSTLPQPTSTKPAVQPTGEPTPRATEAADPGTPPQFSPTSGMESQHSFSRETPSGQQLFEQAVKSYRQNDCQAAIKLFARFLAENTNSIFAPDASIFNADCYLRLSGK